jgi:hypothetical protein
MTQIRALNDDETMTRSLPGATRFLAISAAYLAVMPEAVSSNASNCCVPGVNRSAPMAGTATAGARQ